MPAFKKLPFFLSLALSYVILKASAYPSSLSQEETKNQKFLVAVGGGQLSEVEVYLEVGVHLDVVDFEKEENALHKAARRGSYKAIEAILKAWVGGEQKHIYGQAYKGDEWKRTLVSEIMDRERKRLKAVRLEFLNKKNKKGETPAYLAVIGAHSEALRKLLNFGADPHITNNEGETLLHAAVKSEDVLSVNLLLEKKLHKHTRDNKGETPFDLLYNSQFKSQKNFEAIKKLFDERKETFCEKLNIRKRKMKKEKKNELLHPFRLEGLIRELVLEIDDI